MTPNSNFIYVATSSINAITSFALGLFILLKNPHSKLSQLWWWMSITITIWATFLAICFETAPYNYSLALFAVLTFPLLLGH